ncbi:hypothetical protein HY639_00200 [Candidatus Woesearchaeota archaeon]|nr:hypothetical protein [Candidatus Woesearchaeota archaeon]
MTLDKHLEQARCAVCNCALGDTKLTACTNCETQHHADCAVYSGKCARYGCQTQLTIDEKVRAPSIGRVIRTMAMDYMGGSCLTGFAKGMKVAAVKTNGCLTIDFGKTPPKSAIDAWQHSIESALSPAEKPFYYAGWGTELAAEYVASAWFVYTYGPPTQNPILTAVYIGFLMWFGGKTLLQLGVTCLAYPFVVRPLLDHYHSVKERLMPQDVKPELLDKHIENKDGTK